MKKIIIAVTAILAMASCKKENTLSSLTPAPTAGKSIRKNIYVYNNGTPYTINYTYDAKGRITEIKEDDWWYTFNFVSASSLTITIRKTADNSLDGTRECSLNGKGYVTNIVLKNASGTITGNTVYTYNADGYVVSNKWASALSSTGYEFKYTIADGNVVKVENFYNGTFSNTYQYSYEGNKINKSNFSYSGGWAVQNLLGKNSKNLVAATKGFDPAGNLTYDSKITYELDTDGYPVKETTDNLLTGKQSVNTYIFQ